MIALVITLAPLALQEPVPGTAEATKPRPIEFRLEDVSSAVGLSPYVAADGMGTGLAAADYDDDGDVDVFVPTAEADRLYENVGGGFQDVAALVGLDSPALNRIALWVDVDGDHDLDLFRANDDLHDATSFRLHLQNGVGLFADATPGSGLDVYANDDVDCRRGGVCAGDIDNDGFLDLYTTTWQGLQRLFLNRTNGQFEEIGAASGVRVFEHQWQPMMVDIDQDGWQDIYVAVDFTANRLWINQGDRTFVDRAFEANVNVPMSDMGAYVSDYDDDGDLDLYTTNVEFDNGLPDVSEYNVLLENRSSAEGLAFVDVSHEVGVWRGSWGWGTTIFDADNDGILEFAATNGFKDDQWDYDRSVLWKRLQPGSPLYTEIGRVVGLDDSLWGSALVSLDFDRDGDLDLMQSTMEGIPRLLENHLRRGDTHYLVIRPRTAGANHRAIGATVTVTVGGRSSMRLISAGTSFHGQEPAEAFFGLGAVEVVERVEVVFPRGAHVVLTNVPADRVLTVTP